MKYTEIYAKVVNVVFVFA